MCINLRFTHSPGQVYKLHLWLSFLHAKLITLFIQAIQWFSQLAYEFIHLTGQHWHCPQASWPYHIGYMLLLGWAMIGFDSSNGDMQGEATERIHHHVNGAVVGSYGRPHVVRLCLIAHWGLLFSKTNFYFIFFTPNLIKTYTKN